MVGLLQSSFSRFKKPKSIEAALRMLLSPSIVKEVACMCTYPGEVLEKIAKMENYNKKALLQEVGQLLEVPIREHVHLPSVELVETVNMARRHLREALIVPQENLIKPQSPILAVADTAHAYEHKLHQNQMELCFSSELVRVWNDLDSLTARCDHEKKAENQLIIILRRLVRDAERLGAKEVFIGVPSQNEYEFISNGSVYRGSIAESAIEELNSWVGEDKKNQFPLTRGVEGSFVEVARATGGATSSFIVRTVCPKLHLV